MPVAFEDVILGSWGNMIVFYVKDHATKPANSSSSSSSSAQWE